MSWNNQCGIRWGIAYSLMARWVSSALAGSLSSGGVMIKIIVVIQPYTWYNLFYEMLQINLIRGTWTACGKSDGARAPGPEVLQVTTSDAGVSDSPRKTTTIYTRRKTISKNPRREWEKNEYMNALECLLRADKKGVKKVIGKIVHDFWIEQECGKLMKKFYWTK